MLLGAWLRVTAWASSVLLFLFGIAMTISLGVSSQFPYAVFVLGSGGWVLAYAVRAAVSLGFLVTSSAARQAESDGPWFVWS